MRGDSEMVSFCQLLPCTSVYPSITHHYCVGQCTPDRDHQLTTIRETLSWRLHCVGSCYWIRRVKIIVNYPLCMLYVIQDNHYITTVLPGIKNISCLNLSGTIDFDINNSEYWGRLNSCSINQYIKILYTGYTVLYTIHSWLGEAGLSIYKTQSSKLTFNKNRAILCLYLSWLS